MKLSIRRVNALTDIAAAEWNRIAGENPFLRHEFLAGLERHHCLDGHGWYPCHIVAYADGKPAGAIPLYLKTNSVGEFVFDWNWAEAWERSGKNYYPKLVSAIPFTPVIGNRILTVMEHPEAGALKQALINAAIEWGREAAVSGIHVLFPVAADMELCLDQGWLVRHTFQYHWHNQGYRDFEDFLSVLNSKRRKQIRKERASVRTAGIRIEILKGEEITGAQWRTFRQFYVSTFRRKWGEPRLTLPFFQSLSTAFPDAALLFLASHRGEYIAGAFAMRNADTVYGRHWGCRERFRFLHFELCYYQIIEYCIRHHLQSLDAGVQGEHKLNRGFVPVPACSVHWISDAGLRGAIERYLHDEKQLVTQYMNELSAHTAYKQARATGMEHGQGTHQK